MEILHNSEGRGSCRAENRFRVRCPGYSVAEYLVASGLAPDGSLTTVTHKGRRYHEGFFCFVKIGEFVGLRVQGLCARRLVILLDCVRLLVQNRGDHHHRLLSSWRLLQLTCQHDHLLQ